jgi:hypothetical protein
LSRRYRDPIAVTAADDGQPFAFTWRGQSYRVQVIGRWRLRTRWWDPKRATERTYYRVRTADHAAFELYRDEASGAWMLDTCLD